MGRHEDPTTKGFGEALIVDAARRAYHQEVPPWGLMLDSDGGPANKTLWRWYQTQGFVPALDDPASEKSGVMYAPFKRLIPELGVKAQILSALKLDK
jgi:hypothetical protein